MRLYFKNEFSVQKCLKIPKEGGDNSVQLINSSGSMQSDSDFAFIQAMITESNAIQGLLLAYGMSSFVFAATDHRNLAVIWVFILIARCDWRMILFLPHGVLLSKLVSYKTKNVYNGLPPFIQTLESYVREPRHGYCQQLLGLFVTCGQVLMSASGLTWRRSSHFDKDYSLPISNLAKSSRKWFDILDFKCTK